MSLCTVTGLSLLAHAQLQQHPVSIITRSHVYTRPKQGNKERHERPAYQQCPLSVFRKRHAQPVRVVTTVTASSCVSMIRITWLVSPRTNACSMAVSATLDQGKQLKQSGNAKAVDLFCCAVRAEPHC